MNLRLRSASNRARFAGASLALAGAIGLSAAVTVRGQDGASQPIGGRHAAAPTSAAPVSAPAPHAVGNEAPTAAPTLDVRSDGPPTTGSRITIGMQNPDPGVSYQWMQIEGPPVTIEDPTQSKIQFTIPLDARNLAFLLNMTDGKAKRTARFSIPIENSTLANSSPKNRADAGNEQIGLVGRQITLRAVGTATRREAIAYRWFQLAGPKIENAVEERDYYTFVPKTSGVYRFGLIFASGAGSTAPFISEMNEVRVTVGELPTAFGATAIAGVSNPISVVALDQMLQGPGSIAARATLDQVAAILEAIASRTSLYTSFADLSSEIIRRIDGVLPADPSGSPILVQRRLRATDPAHHDRNAYRRTRPQDAQCRELIVELSSAG